MDTALSYTRQMIEALEYAHDGGVMHRALKPAPVEAVLATGGQRVAIGGDTLDFWWVKSLPLAISCCCRRSRPTSLPPHSVTTRGQYRQADAGQLASCLLELRSTGRV